MSLKRMAGVLAASLGVALAGCGHTISADDYDRTCAADADCVVIFTGDVCGCGCNTGGINKKDLDKSEADRKAVTCVSRPVCGACQGTVAVCSSGKCASKPQQ